jgi:2-hydroxy-6-oxonona-2,4-dienedioate hydrolase
MIPAMNEVKYRAAEARYWAVEGATPEDVWVDLPRLGSRIRVQAVGKGPPLLFVHGGSINGTCFAPLVARLGEFRCLVMDRPGCGLSEPAPLKVRDPEAFSSFAETLVIDVLEALQLERVDVVGTSLGAYYALRTAAAHPAKIDRLVVLGFPIGAPNGPMPLVMRLGGVRSIGWVMARVPMNERAARSILAQIGLRRAMAEGRVPQEGVDWFVALLRHTNTMRNDLSASPIFHGLRGVNPDVLLDDDLLGRIQAPTLFRWGEVDAFGGASVAREFAPRVPGATLEIQPGAGHVVWLDDPDGVASSVKRFLATADVT